MIWNNQYNQIQVKRHTLHRIRYKSRRIRREEHQRKKKEEDNQEDHGETPHYLLTCTTSLTAITKSILLSIQWLYLKTRSYSYLILRNKHGILDLFNTHVIPKITSSLTNTPINQAIHFIKERNITINHIGHIRLHTIIIDNNLLNVLVLSRIAKSKDQ